MSCLSVACLGAGLAVSFLLAGCEPPPPELPPVQAYPVTVLAATRYKVVLIAGDGRLAVFDNAVDSIATRLLDRGKVSASDIQRLSAAATRDGARPASLDDVLAAIGAMKPGPGQGCFVFVTSHGDHRGLMLTMSGEVLSSRALDLALARGCGNAPTAVVMSGCFTGTFALPPMNRANRVVLTGARADRTSFGCGAGRTYTVYDRCLIDALDTEGTWPLAYASVQHCVGAEEIRRHVTASEPQAWFGSAVADMPLPVRGGVSAISRDSRYPGVARTASTWR